MSLLGFLAKASGRAERSPFFLKSETSVDFFAFSIARNKKSSKFAIEQD